MSTPHLGTVVAFDVAVGLGEIERTDGKRFLFHCIEIVDGTRTIELSTAVKFGLVCKLGRYEANAVTRA